MNVATLEMSDFFH